MTHLYHLFTQSLGRALATGVSTGVLLVLLMSCSAPASPATNPVPVVPNESTASTQPDTHVPPEPTSIAQTGVVWTTPVPRKPVASAIPSVTPSAIPTFFVKETETSTPSATPSTMPSSIPSATPTPDDEATPTPDDEATPTPSKEPTLDPRPVIPNLVGLDEQQARTRLNRLDSSIQVNIIQWTDVCEDDGHILETDPPAGEPIDYGSVVELTVCERHDPTNTPTPANALPASMPNLYGLNEQQARGQLMQINPSLMIEVVRHIVPCDYDGMVVNTLPEAGQPVAAHTRVVLTLCLHPTPTALPMPSPTPVPEPPTPVPEPPTPEPEPPTPVPSDKIMPNVIGMHPDEALQIMQKLDVETEFYLVSSDCEREQVATTNPLAGMQMEDGIVVSIGVCAPPPDN